MVNITLTPREALRIQSEQIEYYSVRYPHLAAAAAAATNIEGLDLDEPLPVRLVNRHIPRGCFLGYLIGELF